MRIKSEYVKIEDCIPLGDVLDKLGYTELDKAHSKANSYLLATWSGIYNFQFAKATKYLFEYFKKKLSLFLSTTSRHL